MFVTGPDVIKTVTHEEVTKEELGGAMTHNATSGVAHFAVADDRECLRLDPRAARLPAVEQPRRSAAPRDARSDRSRGRRARHARAGAAEPAVRHARSDPRGRRRRRVPRGAPALRAEHRRRLRAAGRPVRSASSPTSRRVLAGCLDIDASVKGARFVRFCDAFNIPLVTFEDVPGFLPGVRQEHGGIIRARREAAVRVRRGDGAEDHGHHAQGVRRRVLRDGEQAHPHRLQLRVSDGGDRGDGAGRRGQHPLPARARRGGRIRRRCARSSSPSSARSSRTRSSPPSRGFVDEVIQPRADARRSSSPRSPAATTSATRTRRRSTATSRL